MGKLTVTTNAKVKPQDLPSVENPISTVDPLPPKPGAPLTHFVVPQPSAPPVYRPPGRTNGCSKKCKAAIMAAVVLVLVVALIVTGVFFLKAHRRAEKPPCLRSSEERHASRESEEEEDCDEEKNGKWYDWLENCMNQWYGRQPGGKDREEDGPPSSEEGGPPPPRPGTP